MSFVKKTWVDRQSEHPTRRVLTPTGTANEYDVSRSEGLVLEDGDPFNAENMNDLENRVAESINSTGGLTMALLWQNASPTSAFPAQTINLDLSGYDRIRVICYYQNSAYAWEVNGECTVGGKGVCDLVLGSASYLYRVFTTSTTGVVFDNVTGATGAYMVPQMIYGIKGVQNGIS